GDLRKWDTVGFKKVMAIEPNENNMAELKRRQKTGNIKTKIMYLNFGAEKTAKIKSLLEDDSGRLDGIVSFFSMTFFPKSRDLYNNLIKTINLLPEGGKFVGMVMDGHRVRALLEDTREELKIDPDEAIDYYSGGKENESAFSIKQICEFDDNVIGNEIEVDIRSSSSMVVEQTEWLFYFEPFKRELEKRGFRLLSTGFLDKGSMYDKISQQAKVFSALNRTFVFEKARKKEKKSRKLPDELKAEEIDKFSSQYGKDLYYIGTEAGPSNFIHSIVRAVSSKYYGMDQKDRNAYVLKIRRSMAGKLTQSFFEKLHGGKLSTRLQYPLLKDYDSKDAMKIAFLEFKLKLMNKDQFISDASILEIASNILGINIYVLNYNKEPSKLFADSCDEIYVHEKSIVLYTRDGIRYYLIAHKKEEEYYSVFKSSSSFIQKLYGIVCGGEGSSSI
ncbi:MAG: hypothetical protein R3213_08830, partial [Flavobacteriaceae bacterium]|nr:hypothetical protein [Flavobacteriaceae bacterium]